MVRVSRRCGVAVCVLMALFCAAAGAVVAQEEGVLPPGVEAVWDAAQADSQSTPTRERVPMSGLWRWQPAGDALDSVPTDGWGYVQVPGAWPQGAPREGSQSFYPHPDWDLNQLRDGNAAWYQAEIAVPAQWTGRRIALTTEFLHSFATVYVDGEKVGDMHWPSGEVDLTAVCRPGQTHELSMLVLALPLRAIMLAFNDTNAAREVRGSVRRPGLGGDVCLMGTPRGARIGHLRVETSVRKWQITFNTALDDVDPQGKYVLHAEVKDADETVKEFTSEPFTGAEVANGRISVAKNWHPDKLWDMHTPQNQYDVTLSLLDGDGNLLDVALPERFGFREFWIEGRFFYLNGSRVFLSFRRGGPRGGYERARQQLRDLKSVGINFVACGGFGAAPGDHGSFEGVLRAADDEGTLVALTQPHYRQYDWHDPDAEETNGYAKHAEFYTRVAGNHPSVVFYAANHNGTGYSEDMRPDTIDGINNPRTRWQTRNASWALRAQAIVNRFDPTRVYYHHSSGNLGPMFTSNFYANFTPVQEMDDWFAHWAQYGVKPMHTCEYGVPLSWDWSMYRGWYKGTRTFGSAEVPWELCIAEWNAQFYGPESYKITEDEKTNLRWEADKFRKGELWQRWDYPFRLNYAHPERDPVMAMYFTQNLRAFRTHGLSVSAPEGYRNFPLATAALQRNNMPLLAYVGGKPGAFTSKDHNFLPGETVQKQLIIINNSRETVTCECEWSLGLPQALTGTETVSVPTGEQARLPLTFELPADLARGQYTLSAKVLFSTGEVQEDTFTVDVLPQPEPVGAGPKIALFDPTGETAELLTGLGVAFDAVAADADLAAYGVLMIGKNSLTLDGPAPDISGVRDGLKVVIFEQTGEVLEKRFGFRIAEYGLRWVFKRVADHPLLAGIADEHLYNWRGDATVLPPLLDYVLDYSPTVEWCGMRARRGWRCGNRGNVASALIEKPASGDFLPILDGGYALQYASLMEYREGEGMVLFCQTDVTGRTETDPAAEALARNIIRYASSWQPAPRRAVVYVGDPAGKAHLEAAGLSPAAYDGNLSADQVLVVGPGGRQQLAPNAAAVREWVQAGGRVLALGLTGDEASAFLPLTVTTKEAEHIAAYFDTPGVGSPLAGVCPADVHNRDPREMPLVSAGATVVGDGVLAQADGANVVFCQMVPWQLDYSGEKMNIKRTFRKVSYCTTRLLANMGAAGETRLLEHVARPVGEGEQRWLDGLYLDVPETWDDPYRFFRW